MRKLVAKLVCDRCEKEMLLRGISAAEVDYVFLDGWVRISGSISMCQTSDEEGISMGPVRGTENERTGFSHELCPECLEYVTKKLKGCISIISALLE